MINETEFEGLQVEICRQHGCKPSPTHLGSMVGLALGTLGRLPINGLRHPSKQGESGWCIWCGSELSRANNFFSPLHSKHLQEHCPKVIPFLGLPPGYRFLLDGQYVDVWFDPKLLDV